MKIFYFLKYTKEEKNENILFYFLKYTSRTPLEKSHQIEM